MHAKPPGYLPTFCLHFLLPNTLLGVLALGTGSIGGEYGVSHLVWHAEPAKQFWVGFALALVSLEALYIGLLLWGKKAGRPDQLVRFPGLADRIGPSMFAKYCLWVVGQLSVLVAVVALVVLTIQFIGGDAQDTGGMRAADTDDANDIPPPRPNYSAWLPLGGLAAAAVLFLGGFLAKGIIRLLTSPSSKNAPRRLMAWLIDSTEELPPAPPRGGLVVALWAARNRGSRLRRLWVALFIQTLCLSVGVVFAAAWELSRLPVAIGVAATLLLGLVAVRARWLNHPRAFRGFLLVLGCVCYFVVTWLGSRPWCGWPGAFAVTAFLAAILPVGARYAFPTPTASLLRATNSRIVDPSLCRKYPFHAVAVLFFLFGLAALFVLPLVSSDARSPIVLGCFLAFMALAVYGFVAYVIDDALPYLVPALLVMVVLSGLSQYKMRFNGLDYAVAPETEGPVPVLDLQLAVDADLERQKDFDRAVAAALERRGNLPVARGEDVVASDPEVRRAWAAMEEHNRILPGKDNRPEAGQPLTGKLITLDQIDVKSIPATIGGPAGGKKPLVVVVASGGGIRAAAWTFLVLSEIEARFAEEGIPFPFHVRLVTGASGGMFGASYYVRSLAPPSQMDWAGRPADLRERYERLTQDWLTPIVESLATNDVPGFFSPFANPSDRGAALERAWSKGLGGELDASFEDLADGERAGWRPSLAFSPMLVEDGRRLLVSNLDLRYAASNDGHLLGYGEGKPVALDDVNRNYSHEALELFRLFPDSRSRFKLSTAVRMSASFPYFSPAVPLPTKPRRRVVDAGYFDNYGVSLASSFLFSRKNAEWFRDHVSKIAVIQVRDGLSEDERRLQQIPDARRKKGIDSLLSRSLEELTSPIEGITNARVGTSSFRNDGLLEVLSAFFARERGEPRSGGMPHSRRYFTVVNFEFPGHAALSWHLSKAERDQMRATFADPTNDPRAADLHAKITALLEWWKADVFEPPPGLDRVAGLGER